jgi:hypothetical protein
MLHFEVVLEMVPNLFAAGLTAPASPIASAAADRPSLPRDARFVGQPQLRMNHQPLPSLQHALT